MTKVGFIGLGTMGHDMAANLLFSGNPVMVWNRTPDKANDLVCDVASNPRDLGEQCDIVMLCVSDTAAVEEVVFGEHGLMLGMAEGSIIVDHSTISPKATEEFFARAAEYGITWLDAPVSGGAEGATNGTLAVMVGGPADALERVRPYLDAYSKSIVHVGEAPGSGQTVKLINQVLVVVNELAVSEALLLGQAAGVDLAAALAAVEGGAAGSWMLSNRGPLMLKRDWRPGFTIDLQQKDLRLILETAEELGVPMPGSALAHQLYRSLQAKGLGGEGNHALVKALEELAGIEIGG
jgi:3-hydroxyisobutyrate dehydrogenase